MSLTIPIAVFVAIATLVVLVAIMFVGAEESAAVRMARLRQRSEMDEFDVEPASEDGALARLAGAMTPADKKGRAELNSRLVKAGYYGKGTAILYSVAKTLLMLLPVVVGFMAASGGMVSMETGIIAGAIAGLAGTIAPSLWLEWRHKKRQMTIRRSLPDALDVIIICMEGGLSLPASFSRVSSELRLAHPLLADEMAIVQREIQLGRSTGEALRRMADRFDLEEVRSMSSVILQADRFGASVVKAMRVHADTLRMKRYQRAEAMAQKASVKILFPLILCIFPAVFIVLAGPAVMEILEMFESLQQR